MTECVLEVNIQISSDWSRLCSNFSAVWLLTNCQTALEIPNEVWHRRVSFLGLVGCFQVSSSGYIHANTRFGPDQGGYHLARCRP